MPKTIRIPDDENPDYLFSLTHNSLLLDVVNGHVDLQELARKELNARGLDKNGRWIGLGAS